jgi:hypothetical protein
VSRLNGRRFPAIAAAALIATGLASGRALASDVKPVRPSKTVAYQTNCSTPQLSAGARTCSYTFHYTGDIDTFVVPPTTEPVRITAVGAPGGGAREFRSRGAVVTGSFSNLGGVPIFITVGGEGWLDSYNGGGPGGGGGASDVRLGSPDLQHRILVAGGGGGWGEQLIFDHAIGAARLVVAKGGDAGQPGLGSGGQPGTTEQGGSAGGTYFGAGQPGAFGRGGAGANGVGGGGGGGYYGGGGGGACVGTNDHGDLCVDSQPGSGGGGSSLVPPGGTVALSDDPTPSITVTVTQYGWWTIP